MKRGKYNNQKTVQDGICYDSKKEARRGEELALLQRAGLIQGLKRQVAFELQGAFLYHKKTERAIGYIADFVYIEDGKTVVEDVKGMRTPVYKIKRKLFLNKYKDVVFKEV